jgi:hypothetical protein
MSDLARFATICEEALRGQVRDEWLARVTAAATSARNAMPVYALSDACLDHGFKDLWYRGTTIALSLAHETYEQLYERARAKIVLGDWSGWRDYEARQFDPTFRKFTASNHRRWSQRQWDGSEDLSDRGLVIKYEQGFGDTMQMLRFVPLCVPRARHVTLVVKPALYEFAAHNLGHLVHVTSLYPEPWKARDRWIPIMSLPATFQALPQFARFTAPSPMTLRTCPDRCLRVGVCWAGNPRYLKDARRSMPLGALQPLLRHRAIEAHNLYVGLRSADADAYPCLIRPDPPLTSFATTANLIAALDCVVTVDSAVAHLAGSLGVPTFLLLPFAGNWRWGLGDTTAWYPSMCLIRQPAPGDWAGAVIRLLAHLPAWTHAGGGTGERDEPVVA